MITTGDSFTVMLTSVLTIAFGLVGVGFFLLLGIGYLNSLFLGFFQLSCT
jgi:hypothetical protein